MIDTAKPPAKPHNNLYRPGIVLRILVCSGATVNDKTITKQTTNPIELLASFILYFSHKAERFLNLLFCFLSQLFSKDVDLLQNDDT